MAVTIDTTSLPGVTIVRAGSSEEGIVIDYTSYYERIASSLENISSSLEAISGSLGGDSTTVTGILGSIDTNISTLSSNSTTIKNLASGPGIRTVGPYDWLGYMSLYKLYVEDSGAIGLTKLSEYKDKIKSLPTLF